MAKRSQSKRGHDITPADIAKALNGISAWVRSVRAAVLKLDKNTTIKVTRPGGGTAAAPVPIILDGCAPLPPAKAKKKSKK